MSMNLNKIEVKFYIETKNKITNTINHTEILKMFLFAFFFQFF